MARPGLHWRPGRTAALAVILLVAGWSGPAAAGGPAHEERREVVPLGGQVTRRYHLHVPPDLTPGAPVPLVLALHAAGSSAARFKRYAGLDRVADREGFLVAYPEGSGRALLAWNAGDCCGDARALGVDDVGFLVAVVRDVARQWPVDRARVYVTGHSNGAMMAHRLAVEVPERIAAIAAVAGAAAVRQFAPARPVPVLQIHSVDDGRAPYGEESGPPFPVTSANARAHPVEFELARWADRDGCHEPPQLAERRARPAGAWGPAQTATRLVYRPCATGAEVQLWKLTGVGHGWPGADGEVGPPLEPETNLVDAAEEIWRFLRRFTRPDAPD